MPLIEAAAYDVGLMAEDMARVLDRARHRARAVIGGESMGSALAVEFALRYPERVGHLLLTAPAFGDEEQQRGSTSSKIAAAIRSVGLKNFVATHTPDVDKRPALAGAGGRLRRWLLLHARAQRREHCHGD